MLAPTWLSLICSHAAVLSQSDPEDEYLHGSADTPLTWVSGVRVQGTTEVCPELPFAHNALLF